MSIPFVEFENSPRLSLSRRDQTGVRVFLCNWDDWPTFVGYVWGFWITIGNQVQYIPTSAFAAVPGMWPADIQVEPFQPDSPLGGVPIDLGAGMNVYHLAKVTVSYKPFPGSDRRQPNVPNGTFLVVTGDIGANYLTLPGRSWEWSDGTVVDDDVNPGILIPEGTVNMSWRWVPRPPWSAMEACEGCVNSQTFMGYDAGKVLFLGATFEREFQVNDTPLWRIDYRFSRKSVQSTATPGTTFGHNYFYRAKPAGPTDDHWQPIQSHEAPHTPPFQSADFSQLFQFGS